MGVTWTNFLNIHTYIKKEINTKWVHLDKVKLAKHIIDYWYFLTHNCHMIHMYSIWGLQTDLKLCKSVSIFM